MSLTYRNSGNQYDVLEGISLLASLQVSDVMIGCDCRLRDISGFAVVAATNTWPQRLQKTDLG